MTDTNDDEFLLEGGEDDNTPMSEDNDYDDINKRIKQIEEEAQKIREMQVEVEKQFNTTSSSLSSSPAVPQAMSVEEKMLLDSRSVYVGNVDYSATPDQLEEHFRGCGAIERVTILTDKFSGHPKGFAYIQFTESDGMRNALSMTDSLFLGRQIKVTEKRTNRPGISTTNRPPRGRGRARMIVKYIYPGRGGMRGRPRRRGFAPY
ncbi:RNA recognition motif domain-containing protein [Ditylenchus destructor]|uniref:RNA recognition motif domain-containing protein n=1 Tax=Ditylenchus destructor TaxID=166010 RepID=A0AAD4R218_9BILA|nr:RNA recognition motif domain-containing protein [Ditylenchus destructor]